MIPSSHSNIKSYPVHVRDIPQTPAQSNKVRTVFNVPLDVGGESRVMCWNHWQKRSLDMGKSFFSFFLSPLDSLPRQVLIMRAGRVVTRVKVIYLC